MPGDPPTLFPLSRCGLAGTISYGALRLASFIHQVRIVPFPFTTIPSSSFSTRSSISYLCLLDSLNVFFTGLSIVERGFAQRRFASRLFSFFLFSVGSVMLLASEVKGYFHHCCCCYWWHRPAWQTPDSHHSAAACVRSSVRWPIQLRCLFFVLASTTQQPSAKRPISKYRPSPPAIPTTSMPSPWGRRPRAPPRARRPATVIILRWLPTSFGCSFSSSSRHHS